MKKFIACSAVIAFSFAQVDAKLKVFNQIKSKTSDVWVSSKVKAAYVVGTIRESNDIKMQRALEAKQAVLKMNKSLQFHSDDEATLLQNVRILGFDKKNALSSLILVERYCADMSSVLSRYNSKIARWNKSKEMESVAQDVQQALESCKKFVLYFKSHKQCLKVWETMDCYQALVLDWQQNKTLSTEVKSAESLYADIESIKSLITKKSFRLAYPQAYKDLHEYLPVLECKLDKIDAIL